MDHIWMCRSRVKWVHGWCSGPQYMSGKCGWEKKCCEVAGVVRVVELSPRMGKTHGMLWNVHILHLDYVCHGQTMDYLHILGEWSSITEYVQEL